jgi:N-methylhydantoinase B
MTEESFDAIELEIVRTQLESVAEAMGEVLVRGAYSPNIAERRDCSTAVFDAEGRLVAQAEHVPVHLGAMPRAVDRILEADPEPGDVFICNDPYEGGTHLPDVTLVSAVAPDGEIIGYVVSRAHHADVGGSTPGSMPAGATSIHEEGVRIPPVRLVAAGEVQDAVESLFLANVRNPTERRADLRAQLGANERGGARLCELADQYDDRLQAAFSAVGEYSRRRMETAIAELPDGTYKAEGVLEGDGQTTADIPVVATVEISGESLAIDFQGTAPQVAGNLNAPIAVAESAVYFVLRCVTDPDIPPNHGCYAPISVEAPRGTVVNPRPPAAVVGGNVETSQRIMDVVFDALGNAAPDRVPAAGQGTMNNVVVGGGEFTYYETIGGGAGATPSKPGADAVQVGMTNTQNTPIEVLEDAYPLGVNEYSVRRGSGGDGQHAGGNGIVRSLRLEEAATVSLLTDRRRHGPPGRAGGHDGEPGDCVIGGESVPAKVTRDVEAGTEVRIETPGGGGYGAPAAEE